MKGMQMLLRDGVKKKFEAQIYYKSIPLIQFFFFLFYINHFLKR